MADRIRKDRTGATDGEASERGGKSKEGGDAQGTRAGQPDEPARRESAPRTGPGSQPVEKDGADATSEPSTPSSNPSGGPMGAGSEAAEGLHSVGSRDKTNRTGVESMKEREGGKDSPGSEPIHGRSHAHKGSYGGERGEPRR